MSAPITVVQLWSLQRLVTALSESESIEAAVPWVGSMVATLAIAGVIGAWRDETVETLAELVQAEVQRRIGRTAALASLEDFLRPDFHNRLALAAREGADRSYVLVSTLVSIVRAIALTTAAMAALAAVSIWLLVAILVVVGPSVAAAHQLARVSARFSIDETAHSRWRAQLFGGLTGRATAGEVRAYQLGIHLSTLHQTSWTEYLERRSRVTRRRAVVNSATRLAAAAMLGGALAYLLVLVDRGRVELGEAAMAAGALVVVAQSLTSIAGSIGSVLHASAFLHEIGDLLDEPPPVPTGLQAPELHCVELRGVSFRYPSGSVDALTDASIRVGAGEVVALVGPNGSGKSTLALLAAQLLTPSTGEVRWNDLPASSFDEASRRRRIAVMFQGVVRWPFTVEHNVQLGDTERHDPDRIAEALDDVGMTERVARLPREVDTRLGPEYLGGTDLSGGEWQRLALARGAFRNADLLIVDEPSSALDAAAEAELFDRLRTLGEGRAVLVVSHRFSTVKAADRIYVLDEGRVVESGDHRALLAADGIYARLYGLQAARYG
jgi:ATP-binding cassette, subfamily B, bacterial